MIEGLLVYRYSQALIQTPLLIHALYTQYMGRQAGTDEFSVFVENIGGIDSTRIEFTSGVNVLSGENATNRTSLLQGIAAALGSERASLKGDAAHGHSKLVWDEETYYREITEENGSVRFTGEPLIKQGDTEMVELFALLFERNEARQAIKHGKDLRDIVMRPVDTEDINRQIEALKEKRTRLQNELSEIESLRSDVHQLDQRKQELEEQISDISDTLAEKRSQIDDTDIDVGVSKAQQQELDEKLETLRSKRSELERVRSNIATTKETIESLESERQDSKAQLDDCSTSSDDLESIESEIDRLHQQLAGKESMMSELQNLIQFNKDMLEDNLVNQDVFAALHVGANQDSGAVTDQLLQDSEEIVCWTCGSKTEKAGISETVSRLQDVHEDLYGEWRQLQDQIDELEDERTRLTNEQDRREKLEQQLRDLELKLDQNEQSLTRLDEREEELVDTITTLEETIEAIRDDKEDRVLDTYQEASRMEYKLDSLTTERDQVENELQECRQRINEANGLESEINSINEKLDTLRNRVGTIEAQTVEEFNDHMDTVLQILDYTNIERVWIEQKEVETRDGRRNTQKSVFDVHIVRETDDGITYEDTVEHLSESEREVTGLVFALAGNLVHDVHETVPFLLLDSLEAIDSSRIALLVDYLRDFVDTVIVALLPADADAISISHQRITDI